MQGKRVDRVAELVRAQLGSAILSHLRDPRVGFVTVTRVELSADLHYAKVFCSVIGDPTKRRETHEALNHARGFLQRELARELNLRYTPHLDFYLDESLDHSLEIGGLLNEIHKEEEKSPEEHGKSSE